MRETKFREWDFGVKGIREAGWHYWGYIDGQWEGTIYGQPHESQGEFTGLKDKNGKEIYEGDIVRILSQAEPKDTRLRYLYRKTVEWNQKTAGWNISPKRNTHQGYLILGNIYENPELLEGEISA